MAPNQTTLSTTMMSSLTTKASATTLLKKHLGLYIDLEVGSKYRQMVSVPVAPLMDATTFARASAYRVLVESICEKLHNLHPVSDLISAFQHHLPVNVANAEWLASVSVLKFRKLLFHIDYLEPLRYLRHNDSIMYNEVINEDPAQRIESLGYIVVRANIPAHAISPDLPVTMRAFVYEFAIKLPQDLIPAAVGADSTAATTDSTTGHNPEDASTTKVQSPATPVLLRKELNDADIASMSGAEVFAHLSKHLTTLKPTAFFAPTTPSQPSKSPKIPMTARYYSSTRSCFGTW
eukprot:scaffold82058_cov62-Attheya_sp.AAC.1